VTSSDAVGCGYDRHGGGTAVRAKLLVTSGVVLAVAILTACASASASSSEVPSKPLHLQPTLDPQYPLSIDMVRVAGTDRRPTIVDTGSIYFFAGNPRNRVQLHCAHPSAFHYGGGTARYCPTAAPLRMLGIDGSTVELAPKVTMGRAHFSHFLPPYAIIGVSANLEGKNLPGLTPITDQLRPDHLSFRFPNGSQNNAIARFGPLPTGALRGVAKVPLVSPGTLEYGYTAKVSRVDFIAQDRVRATIRTERDGVYLHRDGQRSRIADTNLAFFDTGATEPYVPLNGDISLLSDRVPDALIQFAGAEPYDTVQFTLDVGRGQHVVLSNRVVQSYAPGPFLTVPAASDFPAGLKQLTSVVGLGTLAGYDFQFDFANGRAKTVQFVEH
jgi:hypothetical protein